MTGLHKDPWPEERVERLKQLWEEGHSASQIAKELSGPPFQEYPTVSRNAAIGKVHRLGMSGRIKGKQAVSVKKRAPARTASFRVKPPAKPSIHAEPVLEITEDGRVVVPPAADPCTLLELNDSVCRWPIGDPQHPDFHFCGGATQEAPYCRAHSAIASGGMPTRRLRARVA